MFEQRFYLYCGYSSALLFSASNLSLNDLLQEDSLRWLAKKLDVPSLQLRYLKKLMDLKLVAVSDLYQNLG